jgi:hypothetical protein
MSTSRTATVGASRTCPHCRSMILDSAAMCPQCQKYLRFDSAPTDSEEEHGVQALCIEGTLRSNPEQGAREYTMLLTITDENGEELSRQVVGVGALTPEQARTFSISVRVSEPDETD